MRLFIIAVLVTLAGCAKEAESVAPVGRGFEVERLFTHEGCTVYRFYDVGRAHYYTTCDGSAISAYSENCGKNCTRSLSETIDTRRR